MSEQYTVWRDPGSLGKNNFDICRLVLAVIVIFSHSYALLAGWVPEESFLGSMKLSDLGEVAVDGFFVISGFLVTHSWVRTKKLRDFAMKRILRIYPAFIAALVCCVFAFGPWSTDDPWRPFHSFDLAKAAIGAITLRGDVQDYAFPDNPYPGSMNGSTWSIPIEVRCYAAVVLLGAIGWITKRRWLVVLFAASLANAFVFEFWQLRYGNNLLSYVVGWPATWAHLLPFYLAGMVFYVYRHEIPFKASIAAMSVGGLIAGAFLPSGMSVAAPLFGTYFLFWIAYHPHIRFYNWGRRGDFSYGTYLYAFPIQQLLIKQVPALRDPLILFLAATPISLAAGWLSWNLVERHFLSARKKLNGSELKS